MSSKRVQQGLQQVKQRSNFNWNIHTVFEKYMSKFSVQARIIVQGDLLALFF